MMAAIVFFVLLVGSLIYWGTVVRKSLAPAFTKNELTFTEREPLPGTEIDDAALIQDAPRIVFAERTVSAVDENGNNSYVTRLLQSDRTGERFFPFYETDDLTFERIAPYRSDRLVIFSELGETETRMIDYQGQTDDTLFVPEGFGNLFNEVFSPDEQLLAYIETGDASGFSEEDSGAIPETTIVVRNMETGEETRLPHTLFTHDATQYSRFFLHAFSPDGAVLYLTAAWPGVAFGDPESFFAVDWRAGTVEELTYSSLDELGPEHVLEFIGVYPQHGFALFNQGPFIPDSSGALQNRVRLERYDLATGERTTVYEGSSGTVSSLFNNPVSPDGTRVVVENDFVEGGFRVIDLSTNEVIPVTDNGVFEAWAGDRDHLLYFLSHDGPEYDEQFIALKAVDFSTGEVSEIFRQTVVQEGTGLNTVGDVLYSYITTL